MADVIGARLQKFNTPGSLGVVTDTRYIGCKWPVMDAPFSPFAEGSSGIYVDGPPTPRNINFPVGTVYGPRAGQPKYFLATYEDRQVPKSIEVTETITVRGQVRQVTYRETQNVTERVKVVQEITEEEARG